MEQAYEKLQKAGKNNMNDLIDWMKEAKVMDATKEAEEKVKKLFGTAQKDISFAKFKEVVQQLASDQKKNFEEVSKNLAASGNTVAEKLMAGASALKDKLFK